MACVDFVHSSMKHYVLVMKPMNWTDAAKSCPRYVPSSHLVAIRNEQEQRALEKYLNSISMCCLVEYSYKLNQSGHCSL